MRCKIVLLAVILFAFSALAERVEFYVQNCKIKNQELCSLLEDFIIPYAESQGLSPSHKTIQVVFGSNGWIKVIFRQSEPPFNSFWNDATSRSELNHKMYVAMIDSIPVRVSVYSQTTDIEVLDSITQYSAEVRESIIGLIDIPAPYWTFRLEDGRLHLIEVDTDDLLDRQSGLNRMIPPQYRIQNQ